MQSPAPILAIDPGLRTTGYAIIGTSSQGLVIAEAGIIQTSKNADRGHDLARRLEVLYTGISELLDQWKPQVMAVEQIFAHPSHPRASLMMAHARGVIFLAAAQRSIRPINYTPTRIKKTITGHGRANKTQVQSAIVREFHLSEVPKPHDVTDALAVGLCHYYLANMHGRFAISKDMLCTGVNQDILTDHAESLQRQKRRAN
jgi:crossover junction endodeoxyribonuclease RuvC